MQTAVEWLVNHWKKLQSEGEKMSWNQIIEITELAKEIEKKQIIDAYFAAQTHIVNIVHDIIPVDLTKKAIEENDKEDAIEYYNQTYSK